MSPSPEPPQCALHTGPARACAACTPGLAESKPTMNSYRRQYFSAHQSESVCNGTLVQHDGAESMELENGRAAAGGPRAPVGARALHPAAPGCRGAPPPAPPRGAPNPRLPPMQPAELLRQCGARRARMKRRLERLDLHEVTLQRRSMVGSPAQRHVCDRTQAALSVSEYTDKVDILSWKRKDQRVHAQIKVCSAAPQLRACSFHLGTNGNRHCAGCICRRN